MKRSTKIKLQLSLDLAKRVIQDHSAQIAVTSRRTVQRQLQSLATSFQPHVARVEHVLER
jgi:hypothetical protein